MPRFPNTFRQEKGLCLAEILVSCLIAVAGLTCILNSFLTGRLASTGAKHWTQAMNLTSARIEYLKSLRYADLSSMPTVVTEPSVPLDERDGGTSVTCTRMTSLTKENDGIAINVLVLWNEKAAEAGFVPWTFNLRTWVASPAAPGVGGS